MAERPVFIPAPNSPNLFEVRYFNIVWHGGFAPSQKKKNIINLHSAADEAGLHNLLEVSTKSERKLGQHLSAFHLKLSVNSEEISLESAYQGSKIFENGGPYQDLFKCDPRSAKRDPRLQNSGAVVGFSFLDFKFPTEPKNIFYDWLYLRSIFPHLDWLRRLDEFSGFTDIEFNPLKSINCQARTCAIFVSLINMGILDEEFLKPENFIEFFSMRSQEGFFAQAATKHQPKFL